MDAGIVKPPGKKQTKSKRAAREGLLTSFCRSGERRFSGYVVDTRDPGRKYSVEILVDGYPVRVVRADALVPELVKEQIGDGCYGFSCALLDAVVNDSAVIEARLANLGTPVGTPIELARASDKVPHATIGVLHWLDGLRFTGWLSEPGASASANVHVDGTLVTRVHASTWSHVGGAQDARAVRAFDFNLPDRFADGRVHQIELIDDAGEGTGAKPLTFIAYRDGLREAVAGRGNSEEERLRAQLFDQLLPMSVPFSRYEEWRERFPFLSGSSVALQAAVIMVGPGAMGDTLESLNEQSHSDWVAASLPQTAEPMGLRAELARTFLDGDGADCDFIVFALAGTVFDPSALQRIASAFAQFPKAPAVYADVHLQSKDGSVWPLAFPAFDYERMLEQGYCAYLFALRREITEQALAAGAGTLYRLFNAMLDSGMASSGDIVHLPGPLATLPQFDKNAARQVLAAATTEHLQRRGITAQASLRPPGALPAVQITRTYDRVSTTIIIPTRNRHDLLERCLKSIRPAAAQRKAEILVVDNDSSDPDTVRYLAKIEKRVATVLHVPGEFNYPRLNNAAAKVARGDVLCLLNNDIQALDDQWLDEMLGRLAEPDVGAVGALLLWPSKVVQHGGLVLGPRFSVAHAFSDRVDGDIGYGDLLRVAHECSAVTAACLLTRRSDFQEVEGLDEVRFPINYNDVDYCLKLRARGKRVVFTPHAKLIHSASASRGQDVWADHEERHERELQNLRAKWGAVLAADPYYNPMLSLDPIPFSALAWPPRAMEARVNQPSVPLQIPPGF